MSVGEGVEVNWLQSGVVVGASTVGVSVGTCVLSLTSVGVAVKVGLAVGDEFASSLVAIGVGLGLPGPFAAVESVDFDSVAVGCWAFGA